MIAHARLCTQHTQGRSPRSPVGSVSPLPGTHWLYVTVCGSHHVKCPKEWSGGGKWGDVRDCFVLPNAVLGWSKRSVRAQLCSTSGHRDGDFIRFCARLLKAYGFGGNGKNMNRNWGNWGSYWGETLRVDEKLQACMWCYYPGTKGPTDAFASLGPLTLLCPLVDVLLNNHTKVKDA